ncbi:GntR family transcriptional regulator [Kribbella sp. NPDC051587]|uniref:GntR family transcriptional regulator n=1 Tax=Kribbella sp. NPDC051587 TaxID=3364119 RepID=UPI0037AB9C1D
MNAKAQGGDALSESAAQALHEAGVIAGVPATGKTDLIAGILRDKILSGQLPPATVLPSERTLSAEFEVNRLTVQRAIAVLRSEGLVQSIHGKGVFVRRAGDWPSRTHHRTITVDGDGNYVDSESTGGEWRDIEPPSKYDTNAEGPLALTFGVVEGTLFHASDRLLENDTGTRIFLRNYIPATVAKKLRGIARRPYISARETFKAAKAAGMALDFNDYVGARNPTPADAHSLRIPDGIPMLITRRITTHDGQPILMQETRRSAEDTQLHYRPQ